VGLLGPRPAPLNSPMGLAQLAACVGLPDRRRQCSEGTTPPAVAAKIATISERLHAEVIAPAAPPRPSIAELTWHPGPGPHRGRKRHRTLPTLLSIAGLAPYAAAPDVLPFFGTPGAGLPFSACSRGFSLTGPLATFRAVGPLRAGGYPRARASAFWARSRAAGSISPRPRR